MMGAENGGLVVMTVPMNTSSQIRPQHQPNNQPQSELCMTCYLDESLQIDLVLLFL
jgi:hypothetical protein